MVGTDIYQKLVKGYTEKQWGRDCKDLPSFIIKRLPVRFTYDNNYFNDLYQGIPIGGYNVLIEKLFEGAEIWTGIDFLENREKYMAMGDKTIYTGAIDAYYDFCFGKLNTGLYALRRKFWIQKIIRELPSSIIQIVRHRTLV